MDPLTIMMLAGTALGGLGKLVGGSMGQEIADLQAEIGRTNVANLQRKAGLERDQAGYAYAQGSLAESRTRAQLDRVMGGQTAFAAAGGLDPTTGSPLLLEGFTAAQGATDVALIRANALTGAAAAYSRSASTMADAATAAGQALAAEMKGDQDMVAGIFGAASTLLTGAGQAWKGLGGTGGASGGGGGWTGTYGGDLGRIGLAGVY
ncbi:MAG: hypothetical protein HZA68_12950 [Rhodovulum sp.]|nr:hypothetical protein [Rhodovulum sp.]